MFKIISIIYFYLLCGSQIIQVVPVYGIDCQCGVPSDRIVSMRIVGGRRAEPHSFPWTVAILNRRRMHCGGAMVTNKHVLTAGHCFKRDDYTTMDVLIGLDTFEDLNNVEKRKISQVVIHENFSTTPMTDENEIAIATLQSPIAFNDYVVPICLPHRNLNFGNKVGTVVGWGRMGLLKASLDILSDKNCMPFKLAAFLKPTMMCAFAKNGQLPERGFTRVTPDPVETLCGDSGGPLVVFESDRRYVQAGVVSWGIDCANLAYPGAYINVSYYIDWIKAHTKDGDTCNS